MNEPRPPCDLDAERAIIGAILVDDTVMECCIGLKASDFFDSQHGQLFAGCEALYAKGEHVDQITLADELKRRNQLEEAGGVTYLAECVSAVITPLHTSQHAAMVKRTSLMRRLIQVGAQITQLAYENKDNTERTLTKAEGLLNALRATGDESGLVPIRQIVEEYLGEMAVQAQPDAKRKVRIPTGLSDLDRLLGGLHATDLLILAARPGMGKTSWLANVAEYAALKQALHVAIFSLEMSRAQLLERLLASHAWVDSQKIRLNELGDHDTWRVMQAAGEISEAAIWIDDAGTMTAADIRAKARALHRQHGLDLVMVDYLQLMDGDGRRNENRVQELGTISRGLKALAKELEVPILAAAQLSRAVEGRTGHKPILSDLRDSGSIEQDADVVMFLYREDDASEDQRILDVAKHRNGPTGSVRLKFVGRYTRFHGMEEQPH